ncbi:hypothetical protein [Streptomyces sp. AC04842]|uniref:hypothetical protein n=1 Tax=Streptomyces sp. AC04842 TaxID=2775327 RepID=UPI0020C6F178|nr:hypothetical protein [Streptomyces sp. AC04842]
MRSAGIPPDPAGEKRRHLLDALAEAAADVVRHEDKAVDAARNRCGSTNGGGNNLDRTPSQRFTCKDVTTSEAQGKATNEALKAPGPN